MFVVETRLLRNFFHALRCLRQQIAGAHQAQLQQILMAVLEIGSGSYRFVSGQ